MTQQVHAKLLTSTSIQSSSFATGTGTASYLQHYERNHTEVSSYNSLFLSDYLFLHLHHAKHYGYCVHVAFRTALSCSCLCVKTY